MNTKGLKVKAKIKKHFVCGGVILLCYVYLLTHEISDAEIYGFWAGRKRLCVYTIVVFSFVRTFAPSF